MYSADEKAIMQVIGARITEARQRLELRQEDLAQRVATTQRQISRYERGLTLPGVMMLSQLSDALNVSVDWLLGRSNDPRGVIVNVDDGWSAEAIEAATLINTLSPDDQRTALNLLVFTVNELRLRTRRQQGQ